MIRTQPSHTRHSCAVHSRAGIMRAVRARLVGREPMTGNEDLQLAAEGVLAAHGDKAIRECEAVIARMVERGDRAAEENWKNILAIILQRQTLL